MITIDEISHTLKKCKSLSPGPDGIPLIFIHYFGPKSQILLQKIYNIFWCDGSFPSTWKNGIVIPINKSGKSRFNTEGYRPITLLIEHLNDFHEIYTDASKNDEGVGIAIVKNNLQTSFKLPPTCSIYTAEAVAILMAVKFVYKNENQKYIILKDSLSSLISIKNKFNPSDIAIQIQNRLEEAKKKQYHNPCMDTWTYRNRRQ
jgi:hypothetical protein